MTRSQVKEVTKKVSESTKGKLCTYAGGRCEFDGCNTYLLEHHLTFTNGYFGQSAHIVAFRENGPRGDDPDRPDDINNIKNLMLLCHRCHKLIDDNPQDYPRETLERYKQSHEDRIYYVTGFGPESKTTILQLKAKIGGENVHIDFADIVKAVAPRYPVEKPGHIMDFTGLDHESGDFFKCTLSEIDCTTHRAYAQGQDTQHISVFAIAPIPLLVYLGTRLSNKIKTELYQRHRDTEDWRWKENEIPVNYKLNILRNGINADHVGLLLSLSGKLSLNDLPKEFSESTPVYEITLKNAVPEPTFLRTNQSVENFKVAYQKAIRRIRNAHPQITALHLFPAVPASIAVLSGRELMPKIDPELYVYDNDLREGGFKLKLRCKKNERK